MRDIPGTAILFTAYDIIKSFLNENYKDSGILNLLAGGFSGFIMWFFIYPQDIIKTKYQLNEQITINEIVKDVWMREGLLGFYKGIQLVLCHSIIAGSCSFFVMDMVKNHLKESCY